MNKRKICVVTGTRAEYGLLYWLMKELQLDNEVELQIITTGMHLSPEFGLTYHNIEKDGFTINETVEMLLSSDTPVGIAKSVGLGVIGFSDALQRLKPDIMVVLGDRYEILAAAQAAAIARIPLAHIHGGERTEGLIDEVIRHSVTKMSLFHFTAAEEYRRRVIQLGEEPDRVFNFGAIGLDNVINLELLSVPDFEESINFKLKERNFLVTYHPVTLSRVSSSKAVYELIQALDRYKDVGIILTQANSDTDGRVINEILNSYVKENANHAVMVNTLGQIRYLSAIKYVDVVIGNSSSGLIEVPAFRTPTVNIGERQRGRIKAKSVIDCNESADDIGNAIAMALSDSFREQIEYMDNPYGNGNVSTKIVNFLKNADLSQERIMKKFYDVEYML